MATNNIDGVSAPDTSTTGVIGSIYTDTSTGRTYQCTAIHQYTTMHGKSVEYVWREVKNESGGNAGVSEEQIRAAVKKYLDDNGVNSTASKPKIAEVTLRADGWIDTESPTKHKQVVNVPGVTATSQVDLTPSGDQYEIFHDKVLALVMENLGGVVTAVAVGDKPLRDHVIQVTITEVSV